MMSKRNWTPSQFLALSSKKGNYLVSAGAGSGKTSVLTQRVFELIKNGEAGVENLLVLTFTSKAAQEMKERVRLLIKEDPETAHLAPLVENASIMTFDAFAFDLVKKYHYELGLPKDISIVDESIFEVERKRLLEGILNRLYSDSLSGKDDDFSDLIYHYAIKDDTEIRDFILEIDSFGDLKKDKDEYFSTFIMTHFSETFILSAIKEFEISIREQLNDILEKAKFYSTAEQSDLEISFVTSLLSSPDYDALYRSLVDALYPRKISRVGDDNDKALHDALKKIFGGLKKTLVVGDSSSIRERYFATKKYVATLVRIVESLNAEMEEFKRRYASYGFSDIARLARKAALIPEVNASLKNRYRFIMVDEYQDTSDLQEEFIDSIASDNLFVVGDIKQSIYRFRNADPSLFRERYEKYQRKEDGSLITLAENFRSRPSVINDINAIFASLMSKRVGGVDYQNGQALVYGNHSYDQTETLGDHQLEIDEYQPEEGRDQGDQEARIIALDIAKKVASGYPVFDIKTKSVRPSRYGDFSILIDRRKDFQLYKKAFTDLKIPLEVSDLGTSAELDAVVVIKNLVRLAYLLVTNPADSALPHLYASIMRSFVFGVSDEEICHSLHDGSYRESELFSSLRSHGARLLTGNLEDDLLWLYSEFDLYQKLPRLGDVKANYERLESLLSLSRSMARFDWGLADLVSYFADLDRYEIDLSIEASEKEPSSVQLMTIHGSKGLEFPVVYYSGLTSKFNLRDASSSFLASKKYGIVLPLADNLESRNVFHFLSRGYEVEEDVSERLRLLYVALTRAKEKMILVRPISEKDPPIALALCRSFNDFLSCVKISPQQIKHVEISLPQIDKIRETPDSSFSLAFKSISVQPKIMEKAQASKSLSSSAEEESLRYGEKLHRLLELTDFKKKDVSWIKDEADRALIAKAVALPLFTDAAKATIHHEYAFFYEKANVHGIIDLLLVYDDHIDIVDFKAKSIDDPSYEKQLNTYSSYIQSVDRRPVQTYLLSILESRLKGVK